MKNRKGFIELFTIFVMVLVMIVLMSAQEGLPTINPDNITALNWSRTYENISKPFINPSSSSSLINSIMPIIGKALDFFGYSIFEIAKLAMKVAQENPQIINWKVLLLIILLGLLAPLVWPTFLIIVSLILIIKEWFTIRKEKKQRIHNQKVKGGMD